MTKPEYELQCKVAQWLMLEYPKILFTIAPAGFITSAGIGMKAKRMGYRSGTPDILIFKPSGMFHGMFLELKCGKNDVSDAQKEFLEIAQGLNYYCCVAWDFETAKLNLTSYLENIL
jgi:hypothetical protein